MGRSRRPGRAGSTPRAPCRNGSPEAPLLAPQADATAAIIGDHVWLYGGHDANGPVATVQRGDLGLEAAEGFPDNPDEGKVVVWAVNPAANLPGAARRRDRLVGQRRAVPRRVAASAEGPQRETYWAIPTNAGDIPEWKRLEVSDLPVRPLGRDRSSSPAPTRSSSAASGREGSGRDERPGQHRAAEPVLPAGPGRRHGPGPQDRR